MDNKSNGLTPAEIERLSLLIDQAAAVQQACAKILRHGYDNHHPTTNRDLSNRDLLTKELASFSVSATLLEQEGDFDTLKAMDYYNAKYDSINTWLHHNKTWSLEKMKPFSPMLAAPVDGMILTFPMYVSPKFDGFRALVIDGTVVSRNLKPIRNRYVQSCFGRPEFNGLDGELIVGDPTAPDAFNVTSSRVTAAVGMPDVTFHVFDDFSCPGGFKQRFNSATKRIESKLRFGPVEIVQHNLVKDEFELSLYEDSFLRSGYEGIMIRSIDGPYKHGRSTAKEGWLLKLKRFHDGEAVITGYKELMANTNESTINKLGYKERSSKKEGMVGKEMLGSLMVFDIATKVEFDIGSGFNDEQRKSLWRSRKKLIGKIIKYKSQLSGAKNKPRFPVFHGFRDPSDM